MFFSSILTGFSAFPTLYYLQVLCFEQNPLHCAGLSSQFEAAAAAVHVMRVSCAAASQHSRSVSSNKMKLHTSVLLPLLCVCACSTHAFSSAPRISHSAARIGRIRAGSTTSKPQAAATTEAREVQVTVRSSVGSKWLDRHCTLRVSPNTSVRELRDSIQKAFPGNPPARLQRLFLESRLLADSEKVGDLVSDDADRLVLKLDWVPLSTTQYSTTGATVDEMLSATVSLRAAIQFANQMAAALADEERSSELLRSPAPITATYQKQVEQETRVLPEVFKDQLAAAHAKEADPVEHAQYNEDSEKSLTPAIRSLLKFVNLERSTLQRNAMLGLFFLAVMLNRARLAVWISLLPFLHLFRPVRYWTKVARYLLPPQSGLSLMLLQPLLSPSDIAISRWSGVWQGGEGQRQRETGVIDREDDEDDDDEGDEDEEFEHDEEYEEDDEEAEEDEDEDEDEELDEE
jgi:hypothetical protein